MSVGTLGFAIGQILVGGFYVWATSGLLWRAPSQRQNIRRTEPEQQKYNRIAWHLGLSGVAMISFVLLVLVFGFLGGRLIEGINSPLGWAIGFGMLIPSRWCISYCHVQISAGSATRLHTHTINLLRPVASSFSSRLMSFSGVFGERSSRSSTGLGDIPATELVVAAYQSNDTAEPPQKKGASA